MLQTLLKDRFKLAFHVEKRALEGYALSVGKHGDKLKPSPPEPATAETGAPLNPEDSSAGNGQAKSEQTNNFNGSITHHENSKRTQTVTFDQEKWAQHFADSKMTMGELSKLLGICVGTGTHKVVDETGLKGTYQVAFDCPQPRPQRSVSTGVAGTLPPDPEDGSSLTRSLDALGLKLEKRKMPMNVYVIDYAERPSEN